MTEPVTRPTLEGTAGHTPGPWSVRRSSSLTVDGSDGVAVAFVVRWRRDNGIDMANGHLIAQAPALAAENQKLREALGALSKAIESYRSASAEAGNTMWPWPALDLALASAAPLLEGEGAST